MRIARVSVVDLMGASEVCKTLKIVHDPEAKAREASVQSRRTGSTWPAPTEITVEIPDHSDLGLTSVQQHVQSQWNKQSNDKS